MSPLRLLKGRRADKSREVPFPPPNTTTRFMLHSVHWSAYFCQILSLCEIPLTNCIPATVTPNATNITCLARKGRVSITLRVTTPSLWLASGQGNILGLVIAARTRGGFCCTGIDVFLGVAAFFTAFCFGVGLIFS